MVLSWKAFRAAGIDLAKYLHRGKDGNGYADLSLVESRVRRNREKLIGILSRHFPKLLNKTGYDLEHAPIYDFKRFIGVIYWEFGKGSTRPDIAERELKPIREAIRGAK